MIAPGYTCYIFYIIFVFQLSELLQITELPSGVLLMNLFSKNIVIVFFYK